MPKIHSLKITNYRGIESFEQKFYNESLICLIGNGDSGKTTILYALASVLSPNWNLNFSEVDFYKRNTEIPIEIEVSITDVPPELLVDKKFGLYKRFLDSKGFITDKVSEENKEDILTIRLIVNDSFEPKWYVVNERPSIDDVRISAADRAKFNLFFISDYLDSHFSYSKNSPLFRLLKMTSESKTENIILDANKKIEKAIFDTDSLSELEMNASIVNEEAKKIGLNIDELSTLFDFKNAALKEGNIVLHSDKIPYRMMGKGSKRLLSIAIQLKIIQQGGIILIDEVEQGLESFRIKSLVRQLKSISKGQCFLTTHSVSVIQEIEATSLFLKREKKIDLFHFNGDFQSILRSNSEAFFAKRIIVCEGATEYGILRALDKKRFEDIGEELANDDIIVIDGKGASFIKNAIALVNAGFDVCTFNDDDNLQISEQMSTFKKLGGVVVQCENPFSIEEQLFKDFSWNMVKKLIDKILEKTEEANFLHNIGAKSMKEINEPGDSEMNLRTNLGLCSKKSGWFKTVEKGEYVGDLWFNSIDKLDSNCVLVKEYNELINWMNNGL